MRTTTILRRAAIAVALSCGAGVLTAQGGGAEASRYGGAAVVGMPRDVPLMNPLLATDAVGEQIQRELLFMPLLRYDERLRFVPWLAERWDTVRVSPDTLQLTFHLRDDVRWHDGRPTTARDVLFAFRHATDPAVDYPLATALAHYAPDAEAVDERTVRFRLRAHAEFLHVWAQLPPLPEHLLRAVEAEKMRDHPFFTLRPVGNGPFRVAGRDPGRSWTLEANPGFPAALGGRPYLDRLLLRVVPDPAAMAVELRAGEVDVALSPAPDQVSVLEGDPGVRVAEGPSHQWVYLGWNTRLPLFADARVRRALTLAVDREAIVRAMLHGRADMGRATVAPGHWAFDTSPGTRLPHDPAAARRLLAEAGWVDRDGDGVRTAAAPRCASRSSPTPAIASAPTSPSSSSGSWRRWARAPSRAWWSGTR